MARCSRPCLPDRRRASDAENLPERIELQNTCAHPARQEHATLRSLSQSRRLFYQCEPQGFRRITWFIDRPDVMARYTVTVHADKTAFPFLLASSSRLITVTGGWPPLCDLGRSVQEAGITSSPSSPASSTYCAIPTARVPGARCNWPSTSNQAEARPVRPRDGRAQEVDALGRGDLRP